MTAAGPETVTPSEAETGPIHVLVNPAAGGGRARSVGEDLRQLLDRQRVPFRWSETTRPGDAAELIGGLDRGHASRLLLVGGDGTIADALPGLVGREEAPPVALIPAGTGNDTAKILGLDRCSLSELLAVALASRITTLDAGRVNGRPFLNGFGAGLDGEIAIRAERIRIRAGVLTYLAALLLELPRWKPFRYEAELAGERRSGMATLVTFANGRVFGGGFRLAPTADPADGLLDACIIGAHSRLSIVLQLHRALSGRHVGRPKTDYRTLDKASITFDRPVTGHVDGNLLRGVEKADVEVVPGAIRLTGSLADQSPSSR